METTALIRTQERQAIYESITRHTGNITQVFGPPLVIYQLQDVDRTNSEETVCHSLMCNTMYSLQELYNEMVKILWTELFQSSTWKWDFVCDLNFTLKQIKKVVRRSPKSRHVFVFHKCERFCERGKSPQFLCFLGEILNLFRSDTLKVNIVLSTYKKFPACGVRASLITVGLLTQKEDIFTLLSHYAPGLNVHPYINLCRRYLCLPGPIIHLATKYISSQFYAYSLVELICSKYECLSESLHPDDDVGHTNWLSGSEIELITMVAKTGSNPYSKETVQKIINAEHLNYGHSSYQTLVNNLVIEEKGDNLTVHPLALFKCSTYAQTQRTLHGPTNSYTHLIGNIVTNAELNRQKHGKKGYTYGCSHLEWPEIKQLCLTAIQTGEFKDIFRVAVFAKRLIMVMYPNEAKQFYKGLYDTAQLYGSSREAAVMEALMGHTVASGAGIDFKEALVHLDSALDTLEESGPTFFYKWALRRKAIILFRMGNYQKSKDYFEQADKFRKVTPLPPSDQQTLSVTAIQEEEDNIIGQIYETIPMMNLGDDEDALKKCKDLYETINDRYDNHPDYEVLLNNIGLAIQRTGGSSKDALRMFEKSLKQRLLLVKINPLNLIVTLNNVAMLKFSAGKFVAAEKELLRGLEILREGYWYHHNCAIILTSLADVTVRLKKFKDAYDYLSQTEEILEKVNRDHQLRLEVNMKCVHIRLLLDSQGDTVCQSKEARQLLETQLEVIMDLGSRIKRRMGEDGRHHLMSAYEHGLVFNWRGSKSNSYRDKLLGYVDENAAIRKAMDSGASSLLGNHRHFVRYVKNTREENWRLGEMMENINKSCSVCRNLNKILDQKMWLCERLAPLRPEVTLSSLEMSNIGQRTTYKLVIPPHPLVCRNDSKYVLLYDAKFHEKKLNPPVSGKLVPIDELWSCQAVVMNPSILGESFTTFNNYNSNRLDEKISLSHLVINNSISEQMAQWDTRLIDSETPFLSDMVINSSISSGRLASLGLSVVNPSGFVENTYFITMAVNPSFLLREDVMISLNCINVSGTYSSGLAERSSFIATSIDKCHTMIEDVMIRMNCVNVSSRFLTGFAENATYISAIFSPRIESSCVNISDAFPSELADMISFSTSIINPSLSLTEDMRMNSYFTNISRGVSMCIAESLNPHILPDKSVMEKNVLNVSNNTNDSSDFSSYEMIAENEPSNSISPFSVMNSSTSSNSTTENDVTGSQNAPEVANTHMSDLINEQFCELSCSSSLLDSSSISFPSSTTDDKDGSEISPVTEK
ncbi:hypothetical protein Btru_053841 [Bulinus truncatus]|nr:hypothetical protein Btru_053841 [Bulinus truncatus]